MRDGAERREAQRVEKASDVRNGAERRGAQRVEKASVVGGAKPIALVAPKPLAKRGLMIRFFSQDSFGTTWGTGSVAHASPFASSATPHALPRASGSWTALMHIGAHHSHVRAVTCSSVEDVITI